MTLRRRLKYFCITSIAWISCACLLSTCSKPRNGGSGTTVVTNNTSNNSTVTFAGLTSISLVTSTTLQLNWTDTVGTQRYLVFEVGPSATTLLATLSPPVSSYAISGLTPNTSHTYQVNLIDTLGRVDANTHTVTVTTNSYLDQYCTNFDGISQYVSTGLFETIIGATPVNKFTISLWFKTPGVPILFDALVGSASSDGWGDGFGIWWYSASQIAFHVNDWSLHRAIATVAAPSSWNHAVGVYDASLGSGNILLYINGVAAPSTNYTANMTLSNKAMDIGRLGLHNFSSGKIDDVAVWDTALSASSVLSLYNSGKTFDLNGSSNSYIETAHLKGYWTMGDADTYPTIADHSGASPGTMVNMAPSDFVLDTP